MTPLLVIMGAMIGAPLRYLVDHVVGARYDSAFPWGTLVVNVAGSLSLGFLAVGVITNAVPHSLWMAVGVGLCGALTTYSTLSYETIGLMQHGSRFNAVMNVVINIAAGLGAGTLGAMFALFVVG